MVKQGIYNFCIIAHIDHGKSTLADRMLEVTNTVEQRKMREQLLDSMELERERGITIKLQPVRMEWQEQILNLIDTPGHVDFQYEVSRSLKAVEGAILLVDATQGVQAQTLTTLYQAVESDLIIIPVINKIDLPAADVPETVKEIKQLLGVKEDEILLISAKTGEGVEQLLDEVVKLVPAAKSSAIEADKALRCLIFDSMYDDYKGVVAYVRVVEGAVKAGDGIKLKGTGVSDRVVEAGTFSPGWEARENLQAGEIGYLATGLKEVRQARVGDTIVKSNEKEALALPGFKVPQPKVFAGIYPAQGDEFSKLREALAKLQLNDASLKVQQEQSNALGQGFRCGFLGMLHLDIVQERLKREHKLELVITTPTVHYRISGTNGEVKEVYTPAEWPDPAQVERIEEQYVESEVIVPDKYLGPVFELMKQHEGILTKQEHLGDRRVRLVYELPLRELVVDLYDQLKSATAGFGSLSYELIDWRAAEVVKLSILINHELMEALSLIVPRSKAVKAGRQVVAKMKQVIPRQMYAVPLQAAMGGTILARETLPAMRKDVTGHLYGGDVTRKRKLLEKQKKGKKKMAARGSIDIPPAAYISLLKR